MSVTKRLNRLYQTAPRIPVDQNSRFVLISDCHRGTGSGADNFARNQNLYYVAMQHYYREGYTCIELGDGDELWENRSFTDIEREYSHIFELLSDLYQAGRLHMLYGNHDMAKKKKKWTAENLYTRMDENVDRSAPLFPGIRVEEALVLREQGGTAEILLLHGHQADFFNYDFWRLSRFLVRYVWKPLELIGIQDPFSSSKNRSRRLSVEGLLSAWAHKERRMLIAGHTHRPVFARAGESLYFNDGCCVHPRHITALEIESCNISMVRWNIAAHPNGVLFVNREVVEGPVPLQDYFTEPEHADDGREHSSITSSLD